MKNTIVLAFAFGLIGTTFADFTCSVGVAEGDVGASRTGSAVYSGGGSGSPLVRIEAGDGAYVRFSEADGWSKSVEILALGGDGTQDFFCLADDKDAKLELSYTAGSSEAIPWTTLGASLKPSYVSADAWTHAEKELESRLGATWNTYLARLKANADYLADLGYATKRTDRLLALEINRALGVNAAVPTLASATDISRSARGLPLAFSRSYSSAMYAHFNCGVLGYGWTDNYSLYAELTDEATLTIRMPSGGSYSFSKVTGTWQPEDARDVTKLTETSDAYVLTYENGMVQTFAKSNMRLKTIADNVGNTLTFAWNGTQLQSITHSDGQKLTFAYNADGLLTCVADDLGNQVSYAYDSESMLTSVTATDGTVTRYGYSSATGITAHALKQIAYPDGTTLDFAYQTTESTVALAAIASSAGGTTKFAYPDVGTIQITAPDGGVTTVAMGPSGEVLKATDALGNVVTRTYDGDGLLKSILAPSGKSGQYAYDARGRVTTQTSAAGNKTTFDYTELFGNLKTLKDAKSQSVTYGYDDKGRATSVTFPDGAKMLVEYNEKGDVAKTTNCRGQSETYGYDAEGRVMSRTWANGRAFTYAYDAKGRLITATDSESGQVTMAYDDGDRLTKITYPGSKGFTFAYDAAGRLTKRTAVDGTAECYAYDSVGRVSEVTDGNGQRYVLNAYDVTTGRLAEQLYGNGTSTSYLYDLCGRITSIVHKDASGKITESLQYCYDEDGRCIRAASLLGEERYTYDDDGQLTGVTYPVGENESFAYDAVGNRTSANGATYTVNKLNQYTALSTSTSFTYDADGNLISKTDANDTTTYTYDQQNRLIAVSNPTTKLDWSCTYDVLGNRVSVTTNGVMTTRVMLPGALPSVAAEYQNDTLVKRHIVVGATQIADIDAAGHSNYYHGDLIGSTRLITDQSGATTSRLSYKAFGEVRSQAGNIPTTGYVGTLGVETDPTGLLFMRNRYYDPHLGRFIQRDPIGLHGGDVNWYRYCGNMSVDKDDRIGLTWFDASVNWLLDASDLSGGVIGAGDASAVIASEVADRTLGAVGSQWEDAWLSYGTVYGKGSRISRRGFKFIGTKVVAKGMKWLDLGLWSGGAVADFQTFGFFDRRSWTSIGKRTLNMILSPGVMLGELAAAGVDSFRKNIDQVMATSLMPWIQLTVTVCGGDTGGDSGGDAGGGTGGGDSGGGSTGGGDTGGDVPESGELTVVHSDGVWSGEDSLTATVVGPCTVSFEMKVKFRLLSESAGINFYVDGEFRTGDIANSWCKHSVTIAGSGKHTLMWRVSGKFIKGYSAYPDIVGSVKNIQVVRTGQSSVAASEAISSKCQSHSETLLSSAAEMDHFYTYDRYELVKDYDYSFLLTSDGETPISVSGLPNGLVFTDGCVKGKASVTGTSTVTISAGGETKTVTFEVIDAPTGFAAQYENAGGEVPGSSGGDDSGDDPEPSGDPKFSAEITGVALVPDYGNYNSAELTFVSPSTPLTVPFGTSAVFKVHYNYPKDYSATVWVWPRFDESESGKSSYFGTSGSDDYSGEGFAYGFLTLRTNVECPTIEVTNVVVSTRVSPIPAGTAEYRDLSIASVKLTFVGSTMAPSPSSHTVTFDLGEHGTRTGGGELTQTVEDGAAAEAPTVTAVDGWRFTGWSVDFSKVTSDLTVTAVYEAAQDAQSLSININTGWNWISLNVEPTNAAIGAVFSGVSFADEDVVKSAEGFATYSGGKWYGELTTIKPGVAYMVKKSTAGSQTLTVAGTAAETAVAVKTGWNWIGPTVAEEVSLDALTHSGGFSDEDVIKSADSFATYAGGKWYGELRSLKLGAGYKAKFAKGGTLAFGDEAK